MPSSAARKRLTVYRQFKMQNDPTMNPYLYAAARSAQRGSMTSVGEGFPKA